MFQIKAGDLNEIYILSCINFCMMKLFEKFELHVK